MTATSTHNADDHGQTSDAFRYSFFVFGHAAGRRLTRAAYGAALPVKGASRRYATARRAALDREPPWPLQGRMRGQARACP